MCYLMVLLLFGYLKRCEPILYDETIWSLINMALLLFCYNIIESVDSIYRDSTNTQYYDTSLKNCELISLYNNAPFIFECFHDQQDS